MALLTGLFPSHRTTYDSVCSTDTWDRKDFEACLHSLKFIFFQEIVFENRNQQETWFFFWLFCFGENLKSFQNIPAMYFVCEFVCTYMGVYVCTKTSSLITYFLRPGLSLDLELTPKTGQVMLLPTILSRSIFQKFQAGAATHSFLKNVHTGDPNPRPPACAASTPPTEISPLQSLELCLEATTIIC